MGGRRGGVKKFFRGAKAGFRVLFFCVALLAALSPLSAKEAFEKTGFSSAAEEKAFHGFLEEGLRAGRKEERKPQMRLEVLCEEASVYGFQKGFQWRYDLLMNEVRAHERDFADIFDFRALLLDDKILPPVIREAGPLYRKDSAVSGERLEVQYRIEKPAELVFDTPRYESYLLADTRVLTPDPAFFPKKGSEEGPWRRALREGWLEGSRHAFRVFDRGMARLLADYRGILLWKRLEGLGLVSTPLLDHEHVALQVGRDVLTLDQDRFRIAVPASFLAGGRP